MNKEPGVSQLLRGVPFLIATLYLFAAPFVKVEESFNMQAIHDLLFFSGGSNATLDQFDHHAFPGVVPRTFTGAVVVATIARPIVKLLELLPLPDAFTTTRLAAQIASRGVLGALTCLSLVAVANALGRRAGNLFLLLCASQFHLMYYASRPLPNTYALVLVQLAVARFLEDRVYQSLFLLGCTAAVFRSDVIIFIAPFALALLLTRHVSFLKAVAVGVSSILLSLAVTVPMDSYFWRRWLWPEGAVLWYNTYMNKSSDWGTLPFLWYFYSVLPRALGLFAVLLPFSLVSRSTPPKLKLVALASIGFITLYSFLPHKELRFVIFVFPIFFAVIAHWASAALKFHRWLKLLIFISICVNFALASVMCIASTTNYPGAKGLAAIHEAGLQRSIAENCAGQQAFTVYLDAYACMSGITRFNKMVRGKGPCPNIAWRYSKDPSLFNRSADVYTNADDQPFDYLLVRHEDKQWHLAKGQYDFLSDVTTFASLSLRELRVQEAPYISIFQRNLEPAGQNTSKTEGAPPPRHKDGKDTRNNRARRAVRSKGPREDL